MYACLFKNSVHFLVMRGYFMRSVFFICKKTANARIYNGFCGATVLVIFLLLRRHLAGFAFSSKEPVNKKEIGAFLLVVLSRSFSGFTS